MPSRSPRINVVVSDEQHQLLSELASLQERSAASYLRELLDMATPLYRSLLPILRASSDVQERVASVLSETLETALFDAVAGNPDGDQVDLESFIREMAEVARGECAQPRATSASLDHDGSER